MSAQKSQLNQLWYIHITGYNREGVKKNDMDLQYVIK